MRFFKYQHKEESNEKMVAIWSLFSGLADMSEEKKVNLYYDSNYSHTLDIVKAAMKGSIALDEESVANFNLYAYEAKCKENDKNSRLKKAKDELFIVDVDGEDEITVGYGDVSSYKLGAIENSFNEIMENETFESNIRELYGIREKYIIEMGIDIVKVLKGSLRGIQESINQIKELMDKDDELKTLFVDLCESHKEEGLLSVLESM